MSLNEKASYEIKKSTINQLLDINKNTLTAIGVFLAFIRFSQDHLNTLPHEVSVENGIYSLFLFASYSVLIQLFVDFVSNLDQIKDKSRNLKYFELSISAVILLIMLMFFIEYIFIMGMYLPKFEQIIIHRLYVLASYILFLLFPFMCVVTTIHFSNVVYTKYFKNDKHEFIKKYGFNLMLIVGLSISGMATAYLLKYF